MAYATTTCSNYNPVGSDNSTTSPFANGVSFQFASSTCVTEYEQQSIPGIPDLITTRDSGDLVFGIGLILFIIGFWLAGYFFNSFSKNPR